jgi:hypothetical protein
MNALIISGTKSIPSVDFNPETGILMVKGRLISASNQELQFFMPIIQWLKSYSLKPAAETRMIINFEFCSSSGIKSMYNIFKMLDDMYDDGLKVSVEWKYYPDDEDSKEKGVQFSKLLKLPFIISLNQ